MNAPGISPSMMCADIARLSDVVDDLREAQYLHIDVMDGHFVPNFALGTDYCRMLRGMSNIPLDIHLMVEKPEAHIAAFALKPGDLVSIHIESTNHAQRALKMVQSFGALPAVALNPQTPIAVIEHLLNDIAAVLIMTVNPGYAGQALIPQMIKKIADTRAYLDAAGCAHVRIEVDGNVSFDSAKVMRKVGADLFVAGTSSVFLKDMTVAGGMARLKGCIA